MFEFLRRNSGLIALPIALFTLLLSMYNMVYVHRSQKVDRLMQKDYTSRIALIRKEIGEDQMGEGTKSRWSMKEPIWAIVHRHEAELHATRKVLRERFWAIDGAEADLLGSNGFWDTQLTLMFSDWDNDGVRNFYDQCPDVPVAGKTVLDAAGRGGCPDGVDRDKDGVSDYRDRCLDEGPLPREASQVAQILDIPRKRGPSVIFPADNGCWDLDGDGTADRSDTCRATKPEDRHDTDDRGCAPSDFLVSCSKGPILAPFTPPEIQKWDFAADACPLAPRDDRWRLRCEHDGNAYKRCKVIWTAITP